MKFYTETSWLPFWTTLYFISPLDCWSDRILWYYYCTLLMCTHRHAYWLIYDYVDISTFPKSVFKEVWYIMLLHCQHQWQMAAIAKLWFCCTSQVYLGRPLSLQAWTVLVNMCIWAQMVIIKANALFWRFIVFLLLSVMYVSMCVMGGAYLQLLSVMHLTCINSKCHRFIVTWLTCTLHKHTHTNTHTQRERERHKQFLFKQPASLRLLQVWQGPPREHLMIVFITECALTIKARFCKLSFLPVSQWTLSK